MVPKARVDEHLDPRAAAAEKAGTFAGSPWAGLHAELTGLYAADAVGIFGSAMLGMHLTPDGAVRKDVDFVIEGAGNIPVLREHLLAIRSRLGFTEVTSARQCRQYVRDGDTITIRGRRSDLLGHDVIRVSSFTRHWIQIHNP